MRVNLICATIYRANSQLIWIVIIENLIHTDLSNPICFCLLG